MLPEVSPIQKCPHCRKYYFIEQAKKKYAELLRETGRFEEATGVLLSHTAEEDQWVVEAMLRHIERMDTLPFLLIENGKRVDS